MEHPRDRRYARSTRRSQKPTRLAWGTDDILWAILVVVILVTGLYVGVEWLQQEIKWHRPLERAQVPPGPATP